MIRIEDNLASHIPLTDQPRCLSDQIKSNSEQQQEASKEEMEENREEQVDCASSSPNPETGTETPIDGGSAASFNQSEILKAIEVVERDSLAIAQSFTSLFASLRLALSHATSTTLDHIHCFTDASGRLQESVLDAATKGNRYINSCLRLNEEMKSIDGLASQLKILRRHVDALDSAVNKLVNVS